MSKELQKLFDRAVGGVLKQGTSSLKINQYGGSICMYRGDNGTKCAIGHLIPDSKYDEKMENNGIERLLDHNLFPYKYGAKYLNQLAELQQLHDFNANRYDTEKLSFVKKADKQFISDFKIAAKKFAKAHNLQWNF